MKLMINNALQYDFTNTIFSSKYFQLMRDNTILLEKYNGIKHSMEELEEQNTQLIENQHAKTRLLANVAHDIGSPIEGLKTYLQLVEEGKVDIKDVLPQIINKLTYIQQLNNSLFELSKLESNNISFHLEKISGKLFINEIYQTLLPDHINEKIVYKLGNVNTQIRNMEASVEIDLLRMKQVIQNYFSNAIKYNESNEKIITLSCYMRKLTQNNYEMVVEVNDNGIGISSKEFPYIFERYYQSSINNDEGNGLGLAIVKEIIEQHGGQVGVKSQLSKGSTFYFTLPAFIDYNNLIKK